MCGDIRAEHKDVVQVNSSEVLQAMHGIVHKPLERARGVGEAKGHDFELKEAPLACKGCFELVVGFNADLVVALCQIKAAKYMAARQSV